MSDHPRAPLAFEVTEDRKLLRITPLVESPFVQSANVTDEMIALLVGLRATMEPSHPQTPTSDTEAITHDTMRWYVQGNPSGGVTLFVLHPGTGWIALPLDKPGTERLISVMVQYMPVAPGAVQN